MAISKIVNGLTVNTIRFLSAEAIQKAKSGHPGTPMGAAPAALTLWGAVMKHNPADPDWPDRDRFVLSAGHASMLLYSLLHIFGYGISVEDLKTFRQWGSLAPGHPEYKHTPGVEITTGPLGQGIANAVGFAMAENHLAAKFNKPGLPLVDHYTYALCGDGCLMEGIAQEAISLAGTLKLGKLVLIYDRNNITIEGSTDIAFREDVAKRFEACGWHTQKVDDGNDTDAILTALENAKAVTDMPSLVIVKSIIGYGAPNKQGGAGVHGSPLGDGEIKLAKEHLKFNYESFHVPEEVREQAREWNINAAKKQDEWNVLARKYQSAYPDGWREWEEWNSKELTVDLDNTPDFWRCEGDLATRQSSQKVLNKLCKLVPNLFGGSADLSPSTLTVMEGRGDYGAETPEGANLHFGIREHAMTAIANAIAAHGGLRPYVAGFFVFSDYMKPAMRLSALMKLPVVYVLTHDSIGVGEDGPTHQPVEQLASLRSIPNFTVIRPCDTHETAAGWALAMTRTGSPTALVLSRQGLPLLNETGKENCPDIYKGAYVIKDSVNPATGTPDIILIASGSEVSLIYSAADVLKKRGVNARVVSMPSMEIFEEQSAEYKESVLPKNVRKRLAVEAASSFGWHKYVGLDGDVLCVDTFGASAPAGTVYKEFGITVEEAVARAEAIL